MTPIAQLLGGNSQIKAPKTANELANLIERRDEVQDQLENASEARSDLANQIQRLGTDEALRAGPLARLRAADEEINKLSAELKTSNELITAAKANGLSSDDAAPTVVHVPDVRLPDFEFGTQHQPWQDRLVGSLGTTVPITLATVVLVGALLYWRISRSMRNQLSKLLATQSGRLEELQRSVDTVAVELERVSENQRFVTKLVGDKPGAGVERR